MFCLSNTKIAWKGNVGFPNILDELQCEAHNFHLASSVSYPPCFSEKLFMYTSLPVLLPLLIFSYFSNLLEKKRRNQKFGNLKSSCQWAMFPLKGLEENPLPLAGFWWLALTIPDIPLPVATSLQSLLLSLHDLPCVSVSKLPSFHKNTSHWIEAYSNPLWPHLSLITFAKALFLNKVTFIVPGIRYLLWGHNSTHNSYDSCVDDHVLI